MAATYPNFGRIEGPIVMIGFGSIGRGTLPLIERHFAFDKAKLVVIDPDGGGKAVYRPTCHYAYHPCDDAVLSLHEMAGNAWKRQQTWQILDENEIVDGVDDLGVLLYGHAKNAYWYGSQLSIEETRKLAPYQNATGLQVTSAVLAGIVWMLENPDRGLVEADEMDFRRCLEIQRPYLGPVVGHYTDWTPIQGRNELFPETIDEVDPWQFTNVLVA